MYKRNYSFRTDIVQEVFKIRSCIEMLANNSVESMVRVLDHESSPETLNL